MASRPTVSIATAEGKPSGATQPLPTVFGAPIRPDIVQYVDIARFEDQESNVEMLTDLESQAGAHWHGQEQETALRCEREGWRADLR